MHFHTHGKTGTKINYQLSVAADEIEDGAHEQPPVDIEPIVEGSTPLAVTENWAISGNSSANNS